MPRKNFKESNPVMQFITPTEAPAESPVETTVETPETSLQEIPAEKSPEGVPGETPEGSPQAPATGISEASVGEGLAPEVLVSPGTSETASDVAPAESKPAEEELKGLKEPKCLKKLTETKHETKSCKKKSKSKKLPRLNKLLTKENLTYLHMVTRLDDMDLDEYLNKLLKADQVNRENELAQGAKTETPCKKEEKHLKKCKKSAKKCKLEKVAKEKEQAKDHEQEKVQN